MFPAVCLSDGQSRRVVAGTDDGSGEVTTYSDVCREAAGEFDHAVKYENGGVDAIRLAAHLRALADLLDGLWEADPGHGRILAHDVLEQLTAPLSDP